MKKVKIVLLVMLAFILSFSTYGQDSQKNAYKVEYKKLPSKVKKQVVSLKGFTVLSSTYVVENNKKIYTVKMDDGKSTFDLKLDKNGKIQGTEEDYL